MASIENPPPGALGEVDVELGTDTPASEVTVEDISEGTRREQEAHKNLQRALTAVVGSGILALGALMGWLLERFVV